ncbi:MAG: xanthine dehydrogenase small subunit [Pseudomonadota bacterium]
MRNAIRFALAGEIVAVEGAAPTTTLLDYLRERARKLGTKEGCNEGDCGACTVVLARRTEAGLELRPANSCITLLGMVDGWAVITVEDLADGDRLHPVQSAMVEHHGAQCGFCTPGIVMSLFALWATTEETPSRETVNEWLAGNLCRCTGYRPIVDAAIAACTGARDPYFIARLDALLAPLDEFAADSPLMALSGDGFFAAPREEAGLLTLLAEHPDATLLAGSTDVGLWVTKQFRKLRKIIHLGQVSSLHDIYETDEALTFGAMASYEQVEAAMARFDPDIRQLWQRLGSRQIRAMGTVGGNIANGSPIGDTPPVLIALCATITLGSVGGYRTMPVEDFFLDYGKQDRADTEALLSVHVPKLDDGESVRCFKISKRLDEDISALLCAVKLRMNGDRIADARVAFGGMAATPKRAANTENLLAGLPPATHAMTSALSEALAADFSPISDARASAAYRARVAAGILSKALLEIAGDVEPEAVRIVPRRVVPREPADA